MNFAPCDIFVGNYVAPDAQTVNGGIGLDLWFMNSCRWILQFGAPDGPIARVTVGIFYTYPISDRWFVH
jgi:hypothetical protein